MKKKTDDSSGGPSQSADDDDEGEGEDEQNELKNVILKKLTHEMEKLGTFFEDVEGNKKLRPAEFLNAEIEDCIGKMNDRKDEIQGGNATALIFCPKNG